MLNSSHENHYRSGRRPRPGHEGACRAAQNHYGTNCFGYGPPGPGASQRSPHAEWRSAIYSEEGRPAAEHGAGQSAAGRRMSIALLDVNVLIGLLDPAHPSHEEAHEWFSRQRRKGWATSPITLNGCARVLSSPAYLTVEATTAQVVSYLGKLCASQD